MANRRNRRTRGSRRRNRRTNNSLTQRNKRRFYKRVLKKKDQVLVNSSKPSLNIPINPRYLTKFTASFSGTVPATQDAGYFAVKLNSAYQPFIVGTSSFTDTTAGGTVIGSSALNTIGARGFNNLVSANMYNNFRVYASKIKITGVPHAIADSFLMVVFPSVDASVGSSPAELAQNVAYSKEKIISSNSDMDKNTITHYIDLQSLYGLSKEQLMANENIVGSYNSDPSQLSVWFVRWRNMQSTNTDFTLPVAFNVEVTYYTELFNMNYDNQDTSTIIP